MQDIKEFAPVVIPTLNRHVHFRCLIESLAKCTHADKTEVVIGLDYPPSEKYVEGYKKIKDYLPFITGFKKVTVFTTDYNLGQGKNMKRCFDYVYKHYETYICLEDDNVVSPCFLDYINKCLTKYKDDQSVYAVCGYLYLGIDLPQNDFTVFRAPLFSAWGTGYWIDRRVKYQRYYDPEGIMEFVKSSKVKSFFIKRRLEVYMTLVRMSQGGVIHGDGLLSALLIHKNMDCIYPVKSMVRNIGNDGTGKHCGDDGGAHAHQAIYEYSNIDIIEAPREIGDVVTEKQCKWFWNSYPWYRKVRFWASYLYFKITGNYCDFDSIWQFVKRFKK